MILKLKIWFYLWIFKNFNGYFNVSVKVFYTQIIHETGNFTSAVFKQNNNLFGMREAKTRKRSVEGTNLGHALYKNHYQSIVDYFLRTRNFKISNKNDTAFMVSTVASGYATDTKYLQKWQNLIKQTKSPFLAKIFMYGGLFFLLLTIFIYLLNKKK